MNQQSQNKFLCFATDLGRNMSHISYLLLQRFLISFGFSFSAVALTRNALCRYMPHAADPYPRSLPPKACLRAGRHAQVL